MTRYDQLASKIDDVETIDRAVYGTHDAARRTSLVLNQNTAKILAKYDYATKFWTIEENDDHTYELVKAIRRGDGELIEKVSTLDGNPFIERIAICLVEHDVWQEPESDIARWMYNSGWEMSEENLRWLRAAKKRIEKLANERVS